MESIISFIKDNVNWIKDLFTMVFAGAATIIAILAYRRARATVLQPIRNEVIKKQSKILSEVLEFVSKGVVGMDTELDYLMIVKASAFLLLKDYGFMFKNHEKIYKEIYEKVHLILFCGEGERIEDAEIISTFDEKETVDKKKEIDDREKKRFERMKSGIVEVNRIYLTNKHHDYSCRLIEYSDNPFLPNRISQRLKKIVLDIQTNLAVHMKTVLTKFLKDYSSKYFKEKVYPKFSPNGIFNEFNRQRIHHKADVVILKSEVRDYLKIDDKW